MPTVTVGRRMMLKREGRIACPSFLGYPLGSKKQAKAAHSRYHQKRTRKCAGGHARICRVLARYNIKGYDCGPRPNRNRQ